jgi:hypothetical protein
MVKLKVIDNQHVSQCSGCSMCKNRTLWNGVLLTAALIDVHLRTFIFSLRFSPAPLSEIREFGQRASA